MSKTMFERTFPSLLQCRDLEVYAIAIPLLRTRVSPYTHAHADTRRHAGTHSRTNIKHNNTNIHRFSWLRICGSSSSCFSSARGRLMCAVVRARRHIPNPPCRVPNPPRRMSNLRCYIPSPPCHIPMPSCHIPMPSCHIALPHANPDPRTAIPNDSIIINNNHN